MKEQKAKSNQTRNIAPDSETTHRKSVAKWCAILSVAFAVYFLLLGPFIDIDSPLIGGPKRLLIEDNIASLSINRGFSSLELFLDDDFWLGDGHRIVRIQDGTSTLLGPTDYEVRQSSDRRALTVQLKDKAGFVGETRLFIQFKGSDPGDFPTRKFVNTVVLDRQEVPLTSFHHQFLNLKQSRVQYYKSFTLQNLSSCLARTLGVQLLYVVTALLVILLASQVIVFFGTITEDLLYKGTFQLGPQAKIPINWLDIVSEEYSTLLGFLGTVLSLWIALEQSSMDFSNFFQLLELIKYAVFTTVLGLLIRSIYGLREFVYRISRSSKTRGADQ